MNRRSFLKRLFYGTIGVIGASCGGYYYAREIEPSWLNVSSQEIVSERIPVSFDGFKIAQWSDTHLGFHYDIDKFEKMIDTLQSYQPDLILFTGDLTDDPSKVTEKEYSEIARSLKQFQAPHGKYWIYGNHDHGGYGTDKINEVMSAGGFTLLKNETVSIYQDDSLINLSGLDDVLLGNPQINQLISPAQENDFNILMAHEPDFADTTIDYPFDVQFSGHSHGGQVQFPFIGYLVTPLLGEKYVEGHHLLGTRPLQLFVSTGLGTTRLPFRFLCRPEINIYTMRRP